MGKWIKVGNLVGWGEELPKMNKYKKDNLTEMV